MTGDKAQPAEATPAEAGPRWTPDFADPRHEWRRLFSEAFGTFLLVLAGSGSSVVAAATHQPISRTAAVAAPALTVLAVILFMGKVSGAHLNPAVSVAFALRHEFPWRRVPAYIVVQILGAVCACLLLRLTFGDVGHLGATVPGPGVTDLQALVVEAVLTLGLVSTILGSASGAQNVGALSALAVSGYIAVAGLWSSPVSGASMNPARSIGPALASGEFGHLWLYIAGPLAGAVAAVGAAFVLRGRGGDSEAAEAAQGDV